MKAKTIELVLRKKFDDFVESIEDEELREKVKDDSIITGGAIASIFLRERVNDYDIYFTNEETCYQVADYYVKKFIELGNGPKKDGHDIPIFARRADNRVRIVVQSAGVAGEDKSNNYMYFEMDADPLAERATDYVEEAYTMAAKDLEDEDLKPKYRPVFMTSNAITLSNGVQLVLRFYGPAEEIHENYDFVHCTNYWTSKDRKLHLRKEALVSLLSRELRYVGSKYPICSVMRLRKFLQRGWTIHASQIVKMCLQIGELDLNNFEVLEDQLTGVDVAYFTEILTKLREKNKDGKVDSAYLLEILDRMY